MPTSLPRSQVLLQPETYADVQTIAKHNRRSISAMCSELIEAALKLPKYRQQIEEAVIQVPPKEDPRQLIPQTQRRQFSDAVKKADPNRPDYKAILEGSEQLEDMGLGSIEVDKIEKLKQLLELIS